MVDLKPMKDQSGISLVETLIALGLLSVMALLFSQVQLSQMREMKALSEKVVVLDFEKLLISSLSDGTTCQHILNSPTPLTFDSTAISSTTPAILTPTLPIYAGVKLGVPGPVVAEVGQLISPISNSVRVSSIRLLITEGSAGSFKAHWEIAFDSSKMVRSLKPAVVQTVLVGDITTPTSTRIVSCMGSSSANEPVVTVRRAQVEAWRWPTATVLCQPDEYLLSGGGSCVSLGAPGVGFMFVNTTEPTASGDGWTISCDTPAHQNARAVVHALCAK